VSNTCHWAVVGGGLLGMTVAHTLAKRGCKVTLIDSANHLGGLADAWAIGDITWDRHYHVTLLSDTATRGLLRDLQLDNCMQWRKTQTGFYSQGRLYPFSNALDFARFPLLNPIEKLRLAATILRAARLQDWRSIENLTVEQWLTELSGPGVFNKIWRPLLKAKLGEDYRTTSATFIWASIQRLYAARRSGLKEEMFGYLPGGYGAMLETFEKAIRDEGIRCLCGVKVQQVTQQGDSLTIALEEEGKMTFDRVIVTVPAPLAACLCTGLSQFEKQSLRQVSYLGIICGSVLLQAPLTPYYVTNILDESIPFTGLIEMSALVDPGQLKSHGLLYIPRYLSPDHPDFARSDEDLKTEMLAALKRMHPALSDDKIIAFRISRARHVFPRPTPGYSARVPGVDSSVPGLSILNSAHILNGTLNVNETVSLARREALRLHALAN
jgi:protoporphyrinogen oxidase